MNHSDSNREERTGRFRNIERTPQEREVLPPSSASGPDPKAGTRSPASSTTKADPAPAAELDPLERLRQTQTVKAVEDNSSPIPATSDAAAQSAPQSSRLAFPDFKSFRKSRRPETPAPAPQAAAEERTPSAPRQWKFAPAFWTIASTLSLVVNLVLIVIIFFLLIYVSRLNLQINQLLEYAKLPEDTVKGLYENFVLMDSAHIKTQIPVSLEVPVKFDLAISTQTEVVLSQDTPISQARVTLTTGGLNISNAPANIILPAGTRLPVSLTLTVPVDKTVPVSLVVPVDIPLSQTELHTPFVGLQQVIQPIYCLLNPQAVSNVGLELCPPPDKP